MFSNWRNDVIFRSSVPIPLYTRSVGHKLGLRKINKLGYGLTGRDMEMR